MQIDPRLHNPNFLFREKEITRIHAQWEAGDSVLLTGIRRTGKSELMKAALYRYATNGVAVAYLDVQAESSLPRFYQNLLKALLENMPPNLRQQVAARFEQALKVPSGVMTWLRAHVQKINVLQMVNVELQAVPEEPVLPEDQLLRYWQPIADQIAQQIKESTANQYPVIGLDELPFMLENLLKKGVTAPELILMLASLRTLRDAGLRFIIGGSISFENLLTIHDIPHTILGGLFRLPVAPFSREQAQAYLQKNLQHHYAATPEAVSAVLDTLPDYVPEVLKIAKGFLVTCVDLADCEHCLRNEVMPAVRRSFIQQFSERLAKNYDQAQLLCAEHILDVIAQGEHDGVRLNGQALPDGYQAVLNLLQYDNFIIDAPDNGWRFSLILIRNWWRASRGMA